MGKAERYAQVAVERESSKGGRNPRCLEHRVFARTPTPLPRVWTFVLDEPKTHNISVSTFRAGHNGEANSHLKAMVLIKSSSYPEAMTVRGQTRDLTSVGCEGRCAWARSPGNGNVVDGVELRHHDLTEADLREPATAGPHTAVG